MNKDSAHDLPLTAQVRAWNAWNRAWRSHWAKHGAEDELSETSRRQREGVESAIAALERRDLSILDAGCGAGWLAETLLPFGRVTATDLADEVLARAAEQWPTVKFVSGDFFSVNLPLASFDVVVALELLSHVAEQEKLITRLASLLKPRGLLVLATQNKPILERWSAVSGPIPGQLRRWTNARQLRLLLTPHFNGIAIRSVVPVGDQGLLRIINSHKVNELVGLLVSPAVLKRLKEKAMLGHTLIATAFKSDTESASLAR